jgi:hypothetical protein
MSSTPTTVVELTGQVVAADLRTKRFDVRVDDTTSLSVPLAERFVAAVLDALAQHLVARVIVKGVGERGPRGEVTKVSEVTSVEVVPDTQSSKTSPPDLIEAIQAIFADVPQSEWGNVPKDGAKNLDHYLYGAPKVEE